MVKWKSLKIQISQNCIFHTTQIKLLLHFFNFSTAFEKTNSKIMIMHSKDDVTVPVKYGYEKYHDKYKNSDRFVFELFDDKGHFTKFDGELIEIFISFYDKSLEWEYSDFFVIFCIEYKKQLLKGVFCNVYRENKSARNNAFAGNIANCGKIHQKKN